MNSGGWDWGVLKRNCDHDVLKMRVCVLGLGGYEERVNGAERSQGQTEPFKPLNYNYEGF